jgi:hypothetical protein
MSPNYRHNYEWREIRFAAPVAGAAIAGLTVWQTNSVEGAIGTGLGAILAICAIWAYRIRFGRPGDKK